MSMFKNGPAPDRERVIRGRELREMIETAQTVEGLRPILRALVNASFPADPGDPE